MEEFLDFFFDGTRFVRRNCCGNWNPSMQSLYIQSSLAIFLAYLAIPFAMFLARKNLHELSRYRSVRFMFVAFIVVCGIGHLEGFVSFTWPAYHFFACWHFLTAVISWLALLTLLRIRALKRPQGTWNTKKLD